MASVPDYGVPKFTYEAYEEAADVQQAPAAATTPAPYLVHVQQPTAPVSRHLAVAIIGPDDLLRGSAALAVSQYSNCDVRQFSTYPSDLEELPRLIDAKHDVVIIDLDSNREISMQLVEGVCAGGHSTVMVYSAHPDPNVLVSCMRLGARDFLTIPFDSAVIVEAMERAATRRPSVPVPVARPAGKVYVFMGAKGGVGVTSMACNFAVALAQNPDQKTLLIDLDLPLGDAALNLGIVAEFSTVSALQAADRLDGSFLKQLTVRHSSGVSVLAAPGKFPHYEPSNEALEKLIDVARQEFDVVIVDVGSRLNLTETPLYRQANSIYLVTQAGIPELRNSNRLINQVFAGDGPKLEVVLNRFESRTIGVSEAHITKALTRPAQWKVPNDHALVRKMQIDGSPLVLGDSPLARLIRQMANAVSGQEQAQDSQQGKKKGFSLFG